MPKTRSENVEEITKGMTLLEPCLSQSHFLLRLFGLLDEHAIRYCVLHSYDTLPGEVLSDLDLAVHPHDRAKLPFVLRALLEQGYQPVQCLNYAVGAFYFVFFWFENTTLKSLPIDIIFEHRRNGLILARGEELVGGRQRHGDFWVSDPETEFRYLLAKRSFKESLSERQGERLKLLVSLIGKAQAEKIASELFGKKWKEPVVASCVNETLGSLILTLGRRITWRVLVRNPFNPVRNFLGDTMRRIHRWLQPTGIFVVVLGPDGVGKSTLVAQLVQGFGSAFRRQRVFHWRPQLILPRDGEGAPSTDPHAAPARGILASVTHLFGLCLDYSLGHMLVTRPLLARSGLVVFDRYFQDLLADPLRYRYGGPMWLAWFLPRLLPLPDLFFILLDADEEVILSRKSELPAHELRRLRAAYQELVTSYSSAVIRTDHGPQQTFSVASRRIAEYMAQRFQRRHAAWLDCSATSGAKRPTG